MDTSDKWGSSGLHTWPFVICERFAKRGTVQSQVVRGRYKSVQRDIQQRGMRGTSNRSEQVLSLVLTLADKL